MPRHLVPVGLLYEQSHLNDVWRHAGLDEDPSGSVAPVPLLA